MTIVKVETKEGLAGGVDVESWANPKTQILDFVDEAGNTKPMYKEELKYLGIDEC